MKPPLEFKSRIDKFFVVCIGVLLAFSGIYIAPLFFALTLLFLGILGLAVMPRRPDGLAVMLLLNIVYWLFLVVWKTPMEKIFSYDFLRWDFRGIFAYLVIIAFGFVRIPGMGRKNLEKLLACLIVPASFISFLGVINLLALGLSNPAHSYFSKYFTVKILFDTFWFYGFLRTHETTGAYYSIASLLALALYFTGEYSRKIKLSLLLGYSLCFWGLVGSKARIFLGSFCVSLAVLGAFLFFQYVMKKHKPEILRIYSEKAVVLFFISLLAFITFPGADDRMLITMSYLNNKYLHVMVDKLPAEQPVKDITTGTISDRFIYYKAGLELFQSHPVFGGGIGSFPAQLRKHKKELQVSFEEALAHGHSHNSYIHIAAEMGAFGFLLFFGFWVMVFVKTLKQWKYFANRNLDFESVFCASVFSIIIGLMAASFFDHTLWSPQIMISTNALIGISIYGMTPGQDS